MGLESGTYLDDLNSANPTATDPKSEGDDHLRLIKSVLLATFPNLTGAMTSNQSELNRLDALVGGFLTDAITDAGGTVDTITATFSPAITLTDKTTVIVRASGANTSTTPTFNPNSLGAKTITKNGNQALVAGDIPAADYVMILQYNSTNDVWELVNAGTKAATAISGYSSGQVFYIDSTDGLAAANTISSNVAESTFESIGPTGAGATNTWTALDSIPTTAIALIFNLSIVLQDATGGNILSYVSGRATGETTAYTACYKYRDDKNLVAATATTVVTGTFFIPVDSSNRFDIYWASTADTTETFNLNLVGWIDDQ